MAIVKKIKKKVYIFSISRFLLNNKKELGEQMTNNLYRNTEIAKLNGKNIYFDDTGIMLIYDNENNIYIKITKKDCIEKIIEMWEK